MDLVSDDVVSRAKTGDIGAFEEIYKASSGFVYSIALRMTRSREEAEEVTQDVFIKIHKNLRMFESRSSLKTWVYRIAVNLSINAARKMNRYSASTFDDSIDNVSSSLGEPCADINKVDSDKRLSALLAVLNADQKACILLREVEGLNYKEIALVTGTNLNTVRTRLKRAREAIINAFRKKEVQHGL